MKPLAFVQSPFRKNSEPACSELVLRSVETRFMGSLLSRACLVPSCTKFEITFFAAGVLGSPRPCLRCWVPSRVAHAHQASSKTAASQQQTVRATSLKRATRCNSEKCSWLVWLLCDHSFAAKSLLAAFEKVVAGRFRGAAGRSFAAFYQRQVPCMSSCCNAAPSKDSPTVVRLSTEGGIGAILKRRAKRKVGRRRGNFWWERYILC